MKLRQAQPQFYSLFTTAEQQELIDWLQHKNKIPFKLFYRGEIINHWQNLIAKQKKATFSTIKSDLQFLKEGLIWIDKQQHITQPLTVIDIGVGNGEPVKEILNILTKSKLLKQYIAIDISSEMLALAQNNLHHELPELPILDCQGDFETQSLTEIIPSHGKAKSGHNLWLYIGGTIGNHENRVQVLKNIQNALAEGEYLILTCSLRFTESEDHYSLRDHISVNIAYYFAELLGIDTDDITIKGYFNAAEKSFFTDVILRDNYQIDLEINGVAKTLDFSQGDRLNIYRYYCYEIDTEKNMKSLFEDCENAGLTVISYNLDLLLSRVMLILKNEPSQ
ncbi:MAG: L-histidine N(alpha)-methyltransferase [Kamptonema sp. SIO4C4]|nr:L-histidine N(alpha)-methyltransferase [Kamptonema sp. SIO4C4]